MSVDSNQEKKNKQKLSDKRENSEDKTKHKDKADNPKERKPSKGSGENEKSLLEKLGEEAMNDYKDDSNDNNSDISSDSFTDRGHEPILASYYDSMGLAEMADDRRDSLSISTPQESSEREKERNRHSSSSSSKKSHDKEKEKVRKDKRDKTEEIRDMYSRRESLPFEKKPMPLEADPYTLPYGRKGDGEDGFEKTLEFEKEMSKKDKATAVLGDRTKEKEKKKTRKK